MNEEQLSNVRHSLAHILAAAMRRIYSSDKVKLGVGPVIENGFYYDFDLGDIKISEDDLPKIEKEMQKIIAEKQEFVGEEKSLAEAVEQEKAAGQPYKLELLQDLEQEGATITFYTNGDFTDLCRGGHVKNTSDIPSDAFKLTKVAGAYWRGDEKNAMMTRIYGVAFTTADELKQYLEQQTEAKLRDHRKIGKELDLFVFSDLVGAGLPMFTPRGTVLREELAKLSNELRENLGFQKVWTPHITKTDLYKVSGHLAKFGEGFAVEGQVSKDKFMMKPMNCPHHTRIYASQPRSYRDLPLRYLETTTDYRDEKTGELGGLSRVRALTQDDSHVFCRADQIETEIHNLMTAVDELYKVVGMKLRVRLSYRDESDAYLGDPKIWESAQKQLKDAVIAAKLDYYEQTGEAAFYGPKIDFMATDALGREHQLATAQLDFVQPARFELTYSDENGQDAQPVMIHCAMLGSIERFLSVYIEHTAGKFPIWCAPEQLRVIKVKDDPKVDELASRAMELAHEYGVRALLDDSNNSVGKKIRSAETWKVPYSVVIGEKEAVSGKLPLRVRTDLVADETVEHTYKPEQLMKSIANEARGRVSKSSL